jgi:peptidoglycan/xylan/chitin deacetylase (PgdA/CDA1 family)
MGSGETSTRRPQGASAEVRAGKAAPPESVNLSFPDPADMHPSGRDSGRPLALLSFDVEQFDIPTEYGIQIDVEKQFEIGRAGLATVLELLDKHDVPATFFITAEFALRYQRLTRSIVERGGGAGGHEIASHGYTHGDLEKGHLEESRKVLGEVTGASIRGFRRARMADTDTYAVAAAGDSYNASENPIWLPGRYNHFFRPRRPYVVQTSSGPLVQIPASATPLVRVPLFWLAFKNMPPAMMRLASQWVLASDGALNTYFHPWEFTDIQEYELPKVVRKMDGKPLAARLSAYIDWLKARAELATYNRLAERVCRGVTRK